MSIVSIKWAFSDPKAISRIEMGLRIVPDYEIPLLADALNADPLWLIGLGEVEENQIGG